MLQNQTTIKFIFLGSGPEKEKLESLCSENSLHNVFFFDVVPKKQMQNILISTDASIIPLRKLDLFKGAIPSKIFENLALKKPILLGVDGEARELFINNGNCGLYFEPENHEELAKQIMKLYGNSDLAHTLGENGYSFVSKDFNRDIIAQNFWHELSQIK